MRPSVVQCQRWFVPLAVFLVVVLVPWAVRAAEDRGQVTTENTVPNSQGEVRIDLPVLIRELEGTNPEIKAARQRWEAARAVVPQVQTLPDPRLQFGYQRMPMTEPLQGAMYGFGQEIPFPGKLSLKGEVAQSEVDRLEQEFHATRLRLIASLKEAYFNLHFIHKSTEIVEKNKVLLMQFEKTAKARYSVLALARTKLADAKVTIPLDQGLAFELPYPSQVFDRILTSLLLHHLTRDDKRLTLREAFRVLRPGGELHIADFGPPHHAGMVAVSWIVRWLEEAGDNMNGLLPDLVREAGFQAVEETARYSTAFGTLSLLKAVKPRRMERLS